MSNLDKQEKYKRIRESILKTKQKRQHQRCIIYELKIDESKLTKSELQSLKFMFIQCKWLYNHIISDGDIFNYDTKKRQVITLDKDGQPQTKLLTLPSKMIQSVKFRLQENIKSLHAMKINNHKVGKLKYISTYNSIELNQYGQSHEIKGGNKFRICGIKKHLKVFGLEQIKSNMEFANAKFIQKASGFYIHLTCFEDIISKKICKPIKEVGLDFGIKTNITTSDGEKFNAFIEEHKRLKGLQRKLSRQKKGSNNRHKTIQKNRREYEKLINRKKEKANKTVRYLWNNYSIIYVQDEMIKNWYKELFGKQVHHSCMGLIKSKLFKNSNTFIIDRSFPSTKLCYNCGTLHKSITLADREFICPTCGFSEDRDVKAAKTLLFVGQCKNTYTPMGHRSTNVKKMSDFLNAYANKKQFSVKHGSQHSKVLVVHHPMKEF